MPSRGTGNCTPVSLELLGKAQDLAASLKQEVSALLLGYQVSGLSEVLMEYGAETVYVADHKALKDYRTIAYTSVIEGLVKEHRPNILLMGATHIGRDLAPRVSRRVAVGLTADCTELTIDPAGGDPPPDPAGLRRKCDGHHRQPLLQAPDGHGSAGGDGAAPSAGTQGQVDQGRGLPP